MSNQEFKAFIALNSVERSKAEDALEKGCLYVMSKNGSFKHIAKTINPYKIYRHKIEYRAYLDVQEIPLDKSEVSMINDGFSRMPISIIGYSLVINGEVLTMEKAFKDFKWLDGSVFGVKI